MTRPSEIGDFRMLLPSAMWICETNPPGGWCSAQRINIIMIAGGNHSTIRVTLPYMM